MGRKKKIVQEIENSEPLSHELTVDQDDFLPPEFLENSVESVEKSSFEQSDIEKHRKFDKYK